VSLNTLEYLAGYLNDALRSPSVYAIERRRHWHIRASKSNLWAELVRGLTIDINTQT